MRLADLLYADAYRTLIENAETGYVVGQRLVNDVLCHHLAFSQETIDWQIWIPPDPNAATTASQSGEEDASDVPMMEAADDENYEVVAPPVGATVPYIPDEAVEQTVQGKKYFVYNKTYYRAFASDGDTVYMVVEDPTTA